MSALCCGPPRYATPPSLYCPLRWCVLTRPLACPCLAPSPLAPDPRCVVPGCYPLPHPLLLTVRPWVAVVVWNFVAYTGSLPLPLPCGFVWTTTMATLYQRFTYLPPSPPCPFFANLSGVLNYSCQVYSSPRSPCPLPGWLGTKFPLLLLAPARPSLIARHRHTTPSVRDCGCTLPLNLPLCSSS